MYFQFIFSCLYFFLPAYFANITPPLSKRVGIFNFLDKPVDGGKMFLGQPLFGNHKTWRGVICGLIVGFTTVLVQRGLYRFSAIQNISFLNYRQINIFLLGLLFPGGAVFGDLLFAFVKRRLKLKPGTKFLPFDQTNYVIGAALFLSPFFEIPPVVWISLFILSFFLHIIINRLGFYLGLHNARW